MIGSHQRCEHTFLGIRSQPAEHGLHGTALGSRAKHQAGIDALLPDACQATLRIGGATDDQISLDRSAERVDRRAEGLLDKGLGIGDRSPVDLTPDGNFSKSVRISDANLGFRHARTPAKGRAISIAERRDTTNLTLVRSRR